MKIAVACNTPSPASPVAQRFGRAAWFLIYDTVARQFAALPHRSEQALASDAGIDAARMLRRARVGAVVAGRFGDSAMRILHASHICVAAAGPVTAARALADFKDGHLIDL